MNNPPTADTLLPTLRDLADQRRGIEAAIRHAIDLARMTPTVETHGYDDTQPLLTWGEIGEALGVTRQAAEQRYGTLARGVDKLDRRGMDPLPTDR